MGRHTYDLFQRGIELLDSGKPAQASVLLEEVKKAEPGQASVREALARAYYNQGQYEPAKHHFKRALAIDPTNDFAHFGLALSLERIGKYKKAFGHIKMALVMKPGNRAYQRLALRIEIRMIGSG